MRPSPAPGGGACAFPSTEGAVAYFQTDVALKPFSKYRLSGWVKTQDLSAAKGEGARIQPGGAGHPHPAGFRHAGLDPVEAVFESGANDAFRSTACSAAGARGQGNRLVR
jgi:hypothetical protein